MSSKESLRLSYKGQGCPNALSKGVLAYSPLILLGGTLEKRVEPKTASAIWNNIKKWSHWLG